MRCWCCNDEVIEMAQPEPVENVKLLVALLYQQESALVEAQQRMEGHWGPIDFSGPSHSFDMTDYYESEMGPNLQRRLLSFQHLVPPESLREAKLTANAIEDAMTRQQGRRVNLDVGYLDHNKIVLGSVKSAGHKIHLGQGIYADLVARYGHGRYQPFEWTFPDFRDGRYDDELQRIRQTYLRQRSG